MRVSAELPEKTRLAVTRPTAWNDWRSFADWSAWIDAIDRVVGCGDLSVARESGRWAALRDIPEYFPAFVHEARPRDGIRCASTFYDTYYDTGRMEGVVAEQGRRATLEIIGFPAAQRAHCHRVAGWIEGAFHVIGVPATTSIPACRACGDQRCVFVVDAPGLEPVSIAGNA